MSAKQVNTEVPLRAFITPDDLCLFYGTKLSSRSGRTTHMRTMRDVLQKQPKQLVTIWEFAEYEGLPIEHVISIINAYERKNGRMFVSRPSERMAS